MISANSCARFGRLRTSAKYWKSEATVIGIPYPLLGINWLKESPLESSVNPCGWTIGFSWTVTSAMVAGVSRLSSITPCAIIYANCEEEKECAGSEAWTPTANGYR